MEFKLLLTFALATLLLAPLVALACFSPADPYAIEVLLNKPGISYDLSKLAGLEGVSKVKHFVARVAYAYRSHYDSRLIVIVSEQKLEYVTAYATGSKALANILAKGQVKEEEHVAVRIQLPLKYEVLKVTVHACSINYSREGLSVLGIRFENAKKLGWIVSVRRSLKDKSVSFTMSKWLEEIVLRVEGEGREDRLHLSLKVKGAKDLSSAMLGEFKEAFKAAGLPESLVDECAFKRSEEPREGRFVPAYEIGEEELKEALKVELRWLSEIGAISGLSGDDVEAIASAAKLGYAGWNSRLIWSGSEWIPYSKLKGAILLKCVAPPPEFVIETGAGEQPAPPGPGTPAGPTWAAKLGRLTYILLAALAVAVVAIALILLLRRRS